MIATCFIIVGILVCGYMIYQAVQEDSKQCELVKSNVEHKETLDNIEDLAKQVKQMFDGDGQCDEITFRGIILNHCEYAEWMEKFYLAGKDKIGLAVDHGQPSLISEKLQDNLIDWYGSSDLDSIMLFLSDLLKEATFRKSSSKKISELKESCGLFKRRVTFRGTVTTIYGWEDQWVSINNGEYYTENLNTLYRFNDWKIIDNDDEIWSILEHATLKKCEDPKKEHWEHFLKLEMEAKKLREKECHNFVDSVLAKQVKYNDLQLQYEMLPSAPITDIETFKNFCFTVHEEVCYNDYEIQNYLLLKKQK